MNPRTEPSGPTSSRKPVLSLFFATAGGVGYLPKAPGTFGSLVGLLVAALPWWMLFAVGIVSRDSAVISMSFFGGADFDPFVSAQVWLCAILAVAGVLSASHAARFWRAKDPQRVVIDEVSGQHLALVLGCSVPVFSKAEIPLTGFPFGQVTVHTVLSWKYLLLGFILFRVFDIWKPFPVRQAESLRGGWGIMADDWMAAVYAAIGIWIARAMGL